MQGIASSRLSCLVYMGLTWGTVAEKACSPLNLTYPQSEDIAVNLEITDMIRSKAVQPKPAMQSLKRRVGSRNGRVQMYALSVGLRSAAEIGLANPVQLVDTCIKNGGDHFLAEVASKIFVDELSGVIRSPVCRRRGSERGMLIHVQLTSAEVKQMALKMFQQWALAFQSKRELAFFVGVYNELKNSGESSTS